MLLKTKTCTTYDDAHEFLQCWGIENPESYGIKKIDDYEFELPDLEIIEKILGLWIGQFTVVQSEIGYVVMEFE
jgi:hypothetical protein